MKTVEPLFDNLILENESPSAVYCLYLDNLKARQMGWPTDYLSGALTSGGFRRDRSLTFDEVMERNGELARLLRKSLYTSGILKPDEFIFYPGDTKSPEAWEGDQLKFNLFFILMVLQVEKNEDAVNIEKFVLDNINPEGFYNRNLPREKRLESYKQLVDLVEKYVREHNVAVHPVSRLVELLDTDMSLGSWMEAETARRFGAKIYRLQLNLNAQSSDNDLMNAIDQISMLENIDPSFNFFDGQPAKEIKPIYLVEM